MNTKPTLLLVNSDLNSSQKLQEGVGVQFECFTTQSRNQAREILTREWIQVLVCDEQISCAEDNFLQEVKQRWPETRCILLVENISKPPASDLSEFIYQYLPKAWQEQQLQLMISNACEQFRLERKNETLALELKMSGISNTEAAIKPSSTESYRFKDGIVRSPNSPMNEVCDQMYQVAPYDISVLITGESGTGKELIAKALHNNSLRWDKPFIVENCGALPDELLESELFGYKRGAFTGAVEDREGLFDRANGGTVFLDEIGEISAAFQVKLLRVLQEGEFRPLGCGSSRLVDVRVIAATNKNLEDEVAKGNFREDLYYRIAPVTISLPPLRERAVDIPILADSLLEQAIRDLTKPANGFSPEVYHYLQQYPWPGNVRELQNEISRMLVTSKTLTLTPETLSTRVAGISLCESKDALVENTSHVGSLKDRVEALEAKILLETLVRLGWNKSKAANELGLSRVGLRSKVERYGIEPGMS